jgi:large subunit GTPase 1
MMTCGVLLIDTIRNYVPPVQLVLARIPKEVLEAQYDVKLPPRDSPMYSVEIFLQCVASRRGWLRGAGTPHEAQAARLILKDYTSGKLLYCQVRPDYSEEIYGKLQ